MSITVLDMEVQLAGQAVFSQIGGVPNSERVIAVVPGLFWDWKVMTETNWFNLDIRREAKPGGNAYFIQWCLAHGVEVRPRKEDE